MSTPDSLDHRSGGLCFGVWDASGQDRGKRLRRSPAALSQFSAKPVRSVPGRRNLRLKSVLSLGKFVVTVRRLIVALSLVLSVFAAAPASAQPAEARFAQASGRLTIEAINVDAGIRSVGVTGSGRLAIGRSVRDVYSWKDGAVPGEEGSAVLSGHTWSKGNGVFDNLGKLHRGDLVKIGRKQFKVTRVQTVRGMSHKAVAALFSDLGPARLVLITCGDRNDATGVYRTRILVHAKKFSAHADRLPASE